MELPINAPSEEELTELYADAERSTAGAYPQPQWIRSAGGLWEWVSRDRELQVGFSAREEGELIGRVCGQDLREGGALGTSYYESVFPEEIFGAHRKLLMLTCLVVRSDHRGEGLGRALVCKLAEHARKRERELVLFHHGSPGQAEFYEAVGAELVAQTLEPQDGPVSACRIPLAERSQFEPEKRAKL